MSVHRWQLLGVTVWTQDEPGVLGEECGPPWGLGVLRQGGSVQRPIVGQCGTCKGGCRRTKSDIGDSGDSATP